ncbi:flavoprotein-like protein [Flagelloscypha sp. PMI_526]|nr:flavoprotein-like protein [Flagelloscypha sp. PMI_526]
MCFGKGQGKNFEDASKSKDKTNGTAKSSREQSTKPIKEEKKETPSPSSAPAPTTTTTTPTKKMAPRVAIVIYTMYGHIAQLAEAEKKGIEQAGGEVKIYQVAETLPQEILTKMYAPAKPDYPVITPDQLTEFDAFLFGIPTRYGNFPAQWKAFIDATGQLWATGALAGKYAGVFVSTAGHGGGQESTALASISSLAHHGILFVPFGYSKAFPQLSNLTEVHGGSPWGTFSAPDGSRQPSDLEKEIATIQGKSFYEIVSKVSF